MRKTLIFCMFLFFSFNSFAAAEGNDEVEIYSNPGEMIRLYSAPTSFMYDPPTEGFLDDPNDFIVSSIGTVKNMTNAHDNDGNTSADMGEKSQLIYTFNSPQNVDSIYLYGMAGNLFTMSFLDENGNQLKNFSIEFDKLRGKDEKVPPKEAVISVETPNVKKIVIGINGGYWAAKVYEFEVNLSEVYLPVVDIKSTSTDNSISLNWTNPTHKKLSSIKVNDENKGLVSNLEIEDLKNDTEYTFNISTVYKDGTEINTVYKEKTKKDTTPTAPVENLILKQVNDTNVKLSFDLPKEKDFAKVVISRDGMMVSNNVKESPFVDETKLQYNKQYTYSVTAYDTSNNPSKTITGKITLYSKDITNLVAKADYDKVDLSWVLPTAQKADFVRIYRTNKDAKQTNNTVMRFVKSLFAGSSGEQQLFETNGTFFKDLTVDADTNYRYRLTSIYGTEETDGISVDVKTPKITATGGGTTVDDKGDYTVSWDKPTTGKMEVWVGGKLFATVPAANKKATIPKVQMKYDLIGRPDVKLIPIDDNGNAGNPTTPGSPNSGNSGGGIGTIIGGGTASEVLNAPNLLKSGVGLLGVVGGFVLLGLAFLVVPKLVRTIRTATQARIEQVGRRSKT